MSRWLQIDTADSPPEDRAEFWRASVCDQFVPLAVAPAGGLLRGRVAGGDLAETKFRKIRATRHTFERRAKDIKASDPGVLHLLLQDHGRSVMEQDGRTATLMPGDLLLYDSSRPFHFETDGDFQFTICLLPKKLLPLPEKLQRERTARVFDSQQGIGAAIAPFLVSLASHSIDAPSGQQLALQHAMVTMYVALMDAEEELTRPPSVHLSMAKSFLARNLSDPNLSPADVAAACNISLSYLHRLFTNEGTTVAGFIREQRLQGAYRDLAAPTATEPIIRIAERWGLPDPSHFNRTFKQRFSTTPGELRRTRNQ